MTCLLLGSFAGSYGRGGAHHLMDKKMALYLRRWPWEGDSVRLSSLWPSCWGQIWNGRGWTPRSSGCLWRKALRGQGFGLWQRMPRKGLAGEAGGDPCPLESPAGIGIVLLSGFLSLGGGRFQSRCPMFSSGSLILSEKHRGKTQRLRERTIPKAC